MSPQSPPLIFEISTPGVRAVDLPPCDVPHAEIDPAIGTFTETGLPELGQLDLVRHYTRLSQRSFCLDTAAHPAAGSTMKFNPPVNETLAALPGFGRLHPLQRDADCQGALGLLYHLRMMLQEVAGLTEVSLQPCAGAHAQWTALRMMLACQRDGGQSQRRIVLVADTSHGTNPASAAAAGAMVESVRTGPDGLLDLDDLRRRLARRDVAAVMLAQPNSCGKFDPRFGDLVKLGHDSGAMVYLDAVNLNAILGIVRPGELGVDAMHFPTHLSLATPHGSGGPGAGPLAVSERLAPYLPVPQVVQIDGRFAWSFDRPSSIGRVSGFSGQFGVLVRAYAYLRALGPSGLRRASEMAVLCANYLAQSLRNVCQLPYGPAADQPMAASPCGNSFVAVPRALLDRGVTTLDICKALIDRGIYPPTVHWPLPDCLTIEPTETESKATLDAFAAAMREIADLSVKDPEALREAPSSATVRRVNEPAAARNPVFTWRRDVV